MDMIDQGFFTIFYQVDIFDMIACIYVGKNTGKFAHIMPAFILYPSTGYKVIDRNRVLLPQKQQYQEMEVESFVQELRLRMIAIAVIIVRNMCFILKNLDELILF